MLTPMQTYKRDPTYRRFAGLDLQDPNALERLNLVEVHKAELVGFRESYVHIASPRDYDRLALTEALVPQAEHTKLRFLLKEVKCLDESGSAPFDWGSDESTWAPWASMRMESGSPGACSTSATSTTVT